MDAEKPDSHPDSQATIPKLGCLLTYLSNTTLMSWVSVDLLVKQNPHVLGVC